MSLLKTVVLLDVVKVVSPDDNSPFHFHALHNSRENSSSYTYVTRKWTLLVNVGTFYCLCVCMYVSCVPGV